MAGRFLIPVSRFQGDVITFVDGPPYDGAEKFPAATLAVPVRHGASMGDLEVTSVRDLRYGRNRPRFRVLYREGIGRLREEILAPTRLELVPVGYRVLLQVEAGRRQMIQSDSQGVVHAVEVTDYRVTGYSLCGHYIADNIPVLTGVPTCSACLAEPRLWVPFFVRPYTRTVKKGRTKEQRALAEYARRPSVFDKLLDDAYLDPNIPEPVPAPFVIDPETLDETEDFVDPREGKVEVRVKTGQRFKADKQALKTEILAARRR